MWLTTRRIWSALVDGLPVGLGLVDRIGKTISDRGEVQDSASEKLGEVRREMKITFERMMSRLQKYISDPHTAKMLQEPIITQRNGRNVLPLRAEFKGRIKAVIHDQSSSGATLFIEPLAVVEWNNRYRELELAERDEVRRILAELSHDCGDGRRPAQYDGDRAGRAGPGLHAGPLCGGPGRQRTGSAGLPGIP